MLGIEPNYLFSNGGLDANWLDKHGVPTVTIGAGQAEIHTIKEYVNLPEFATGLPPRAALGDTRRLVGVRIKPFDRTRSPVQLRIVSASFGDASRRLDEEMSD